jgi:signal transduction histidine kinase
MSEADTNGKPAAHPVVRIGIEAQSVRCVAYTLAGLLGLISVQLDLITASFFDIAVAVAIAYLSCGLFYLLYRAQGAAGSRLYLEPAWLVCDAALITWGVHLTGGIDSAWFPWYLANFAAAGFVLGQGWALAIALLDTAAYLGLLMLRGEISDLATASQPLLRMIFLTGAAVFFLRGFSTLRRRQRLIRRLRADEQRQLDEFRQVTEELDQRTHELQAVNLELQEATRLKSQFLANMSHELRTPLNSIIGFSEVLLKRLTDQLSARHLRFLENIHFSGQQLLAMINDILDLSKIEVGDMEVQPVTLSLDSVVEGVVRIVKGDVKQRRIEIETHLPAKPLRLEADPSRFKQILYNLVANAVKFSPDGSSVEVHARQLAAPVSPLGVTSVELAVVDHGIGISQPDQSMIFEEFRQVDGSSTRKFRGAGLGLALVKRFTEIHGGMVTVASEPGKGSTFTVVMPQHYVGDGGKDLQPGTPGQEASVEPTVVATRPEE